MDEDADDVMSVDDNDNDEDEDEDEDEEGDANVADEGDDNDDGEVAEEEGIDGPDEADEEVDDDGNGDEEAEIVEEDGIEGPSPAATANPLQIRTTQEAEHADIVKDDPFLVFPRIPGPAELLVEDGRALYKEGKLLEAHQMFERALRTADGSLEQYLVLSLLLNIGECVVRMAEDLGDGARARGEEVLQRALNIIDGGPSDHERQACHYYVLDDAKVWWESELVPPAEKKRKKGKGKGKKGEKGKKGKGKKKSSGVKKKKKS